MDSTHNPYGGYKIEPLKGDKIQQIKAQIEDMHRRLNELELALADGVDIPPYTLK